MTPAQLSRSVLHAVHRAVAEGALRVPVPEKAQVERARPGGCGDYASSIALKLAGPAGLPSREVAEILRSRVAGLPGIGRVEITGPGFLNFTVAGADRAELVRAIRSQGPRFGYGTGLAGQEVWFAPADELRAQVVTETVVRLLLAQGAVAGALPDHAPSAPDQALRAGGERVRVRAMARDAGEVFGLLGEDAARWALLRPAAPDAPVLDPARLLAQREANPLFRIRYAHARTRALLRNARDLGIETTVEIPIDTGVETGSGATTDGGAYAEPAAAELIGLLGEYPRVLQAAARHRAPDRLARHLEALADAFFRCHDACPPLPRGDEKPSAAHRSRLALADAAGTVLAGGLSLLGISAPEFL